MRIIVYEHETNIISQSKMFNSLISIKTLIALIDTIFLTSTFATIITENRISKLLKLWEGYFCNFSGYC